MKERLYTFTELVNFGNYMLRQTEKRKCRDICEFKAAMDAYINGLKNLR